VPKSEEAGRERWWQRERHRHLRECMGQLCRELKSFRRERINMCELVFILLKLSVAVLYEKCC
jgi:hypothetical protein